MSEPLVSVIIAARNAEKTMRKCLDSVLGVDYPCLEVIVVNDRSTDRTSDILGGYAGRITVLDNAVASGPSESRNRAAGVAKGEYLAFCDSDCLVQRSWLKELMRGFDSHDIVSVGGRQDIPPDETDFGRIVHEFMRKAHFIADYAREGNGKIMDVSHNPSCNVIYKKEVFLGIGGFCRGLWPAEDVELDHRLRLRGFRIRYNPAAVVFHYRVSTFSSFLGMMHRYGKAQGLLAHKYGIFRRIQWVPFLTLSCWALLVFLAAWNPGLFLSAVMVLAAVTFVYYNSDPRLVSLAFAGLIYWHMGYFQGLMRIRRD